MSKKEKNTTPQRFKVVPLLAQNFIRDYDDAVKQYELPQQLELTDHLLAVMDLMEQYTETTDDAIWKQYSEKEDALLKKYGKTLKPYAAKYFYKYFSFDIVLAEKEIYSGEEFNRLTSDEQGLTLNERLSFIRWCHNSLYNARTFLYLQMEPENAEVPTDLSGGQADPDREATKARQLLAIYYLLKAGWGIEQRDSHSVSALTRFAHLMTGTKITNIQNSDIYKKYSKMPNFKNGEHLIADLKFIRPYFEELHIEKAVQLIDEEIRRAVKELPAIVRKKYRDNDK
jgi:hypothetical protein